MDITECSKQNQSLLVSTVLRKVAIFQCILFERASVALRAPSARKQGGSTTIFLRASRELSVTSEWWWIATIIIGYQSMGLEDRKENLNKSWTLFVLVDNSWPICLASRPISSSEAMSKVDCWYIGYSKLECQRSEHLAMFDGTVYMDSYLHQDRPSHFMWPEIHFNIYSCIGQCIHQNFPKSIITYYSILFGHLRLVIWNNTR